MQIATARSVQNDEERTFHQARGKCQSLESAIGCVNLDLGVVMPED